MADNIRATPQNPYTGALARGLRSLQQLAGQYQVDPRIPLLGGTSVDELLSLPGAASLAEDVSYYGPRALIRGGNVATGGIGTFRLDPRVADVADVAMNVTPLAAMAGKTATRGAMAAGRAGERLAERVVPQVMERGGIGAQLMQDMVTGSRSQVVKPKGGNWLAGSIEREIAPMRVKVIGQDPAARLRDLDAAYAQNVEAGVEVNPELFARERSRLESEAAMNRWLDTKLAKYIKNEMGTAEDPIRALAEKGPIHSEILPTGYNVTRARREAGFPEEGMGVSPLAKTWEDRADTFINPLKASDITGYYPETVKENPWLLKVPPETPVYEMLQGSAGQGMLGFGHLVDELKNAINPTSGLPENLRWKYQDLEKVTVPQAVQRVADINAWRAAQKVEADMARAMGPATQVFKEYPEQGFKWVELKAPKETGRKITVEKSEMDLPPDMDQRQMREVAEDMAFDEGFDEGTPEFNDFVRNLMTDFNRKKKVEMDESYKALEDALKYEGETMGHCVGGYCPDVIEGRSKIFSLRDKKGQPHVTIEVRPGEGSVYQYLASKNLDLEKEAQKLYPKSSKIASQDLLISDIEATPEYAEWVRSLPHEIVQIKGSGKKDPGQKIRHAGTGYKDNPDAHLLPMVHDFVRSQNWSNVGDLKNTGLVDLQQMGVPAEMRGGQRFVTEDEYKDIVRKNAEGFASGGLVSGANFHTDDFDPARIGSIVDELHAMNAG